MYWEHPSILLTLWGLPLLARLLVHAHRRRIAAARAFVDPAMVPRLVPATGPGRPWIKGLPLLCSRSTPGRTPRSHVARYKPESTLPLRKSEYPKKSQILGEAALATNSPVG
jgi:hypothetical protein